jgi:AcrR family transcriptional regulator
MPPDHTPRRRTPTADCGKKSAPLTRADWIAAARRLLVSKGISAVKVEPLAKQLDVTPGSFYWHFTGRPDLHDALLRHWREINTETLFRAVTNAPDDPRSQYLAFFGVWVLERNFDPRLDQAVRAWGRTSRRIMAIVRAEDLARIELLKGIFLGFGFPDLKAEMRARVTYYHQVGYYALGIHETKEQRLALVPEYAEILTDDDWLVCSASIEEIMTVMLAARSAALG